MTDATLPPPHEPHFCNLEHGGTFCKVCQPESQDAAILPVVAWGAKITKAREVCDPNFVAYESEEETRDMILAWNSIYECFPLTPQVPVQATIDALRLENERLTKERDAAKSRFKTLLAQEHALSDSYVRIREMVGAMNPPALTPEALFPYVEASVAAAIKEKQIDVEAVMRLAEVYAKASSELDESIRSRSRAPRLVNRHDLRVHVAFKAAREALRASLLGDGGTL